MTPLSDVECHFEDGDACNPRIVYPNRKLSAAFFVQTTNEMGIIIIIMFASIPQNPQSSIQKDFANYDTSLHYGKTHHITNQFCYFRSFVRLLQYARTQSIVFRNSLLSSARSFVISLFFFFLRSPFGTM